MEYNMKPEKVKKLVRVLQIIMQVFYWVGIIAAALMGVVAFVLLFIPESKFVFIPGEHLSTGFTIDGMIKFNLKSIDNESINIKAILISGLFMGTVVSGLLAPVFYQMSMILKTVGQDRPFDAKNAGRLTVIGTILIVGSFVVQVVKAAMGSAIVNALELPDITINYSVDITMLVTGILIIILAGVFKYGSYLQQEYDATV